MGVRGSGRGRARDIRARAHVPAVRRTDGPSAVRSRLGIANDDWFIIGGGDGFVAVVDPGDPRTIYTESQDGRMYRVDRATNERATIRPEPAKGEKLLQRRRPSSDRAPTPTRPEPS